MNKIVIVCLFFKIIHQATLRLLPCFVFFMHLGQVDVNDIHVLGCGIVGWKPPANTGGEMPGYAIRFFDGQSYETSQYQEIQLYFDDPNRRWAVATNLPKSINVYVDVSILM